MKTSYLSVDRDDKAYMTVVNLLYEGRIKFHPYEPLRTEFFQLDHDRAKSKVDHPQFNADGSPGSKDVADAWVGAIHACVHGMEVGGVVLPELANEIRSATHHHPAPYEGGGDFSWVVPKKYRKSVADDIEVQKIGPSLGDGAPEGGPDDEPF